MANEESFYIPGTDARNGYRYTIIKSGTPEEFPYVEWLDRDTKWVYDVRITWSGNVNSTYWYIEEYEDNIFGYKAMNDLAEFISQGFWESLEDVLTHIVLTDRSKSHGQS